MSVVLQQHCPVERPALIESCGCQGGLFGVQMCWGQRVCVKWHPHECQDQGFSSRALHCGEVIFVIHQLSVVSVSFLIYVLYLKENTIISGGCKLLNNSECALLFTFKQHKGFLNVTGKFQCHKTFQVS